MKLFVRDRNFYRTLLILAVPIALQSLITVGVNMMDNIMLGSLGEVKMSGLCGCQCHYGGGGV